MIHITKFLRDFWDVTKLVIYKHMKQIKNFIGWQTSPLNIYKLNFDGLSSASGEAVAGFVI